MERSKAKAASSQNPQKAESGSRNLSDPAVYDLVQAAEEAWVSRGFDSVREFATVVAIERATKLIQAHAKEDLDKHGVTYAGWLTLTVLSYARHRALPTAKLAARVGTHPTSLTKTVDHLVRAGYAQRKGKRGDRRVVMVELTEEGDLAQQQINKSRAEGRFGLSELTVGELDELVRLLRKVRLSLGDLWQNERSPTTSS